MKKLEIHTPKISIAEELLVDACIYMQSNFRGNEVSEAAIEEVFDFIDYIYSHFEDGWRIDSIGDASLCIYQIDENKNDIFIAALYTLKSHRGKGYGSALIKHVIELRDNKYPEMSITLAVDVGNKSAQSLYKSLGFQEESITEDGISFIYKM